MKKLLLFTFFALAAINVSASEKPKKTDETDVAKVVARYVWNNPIKCAVAAALALDCAINGYNSSVAKNAVNFAKESGEQFLADGKAIQSLAQGAITSIRMKVS